MTQENENSDRSSDLYAPDTIPHINRAELAEAIVSELYDQADELVEHITTCLKTATHLLPSGANYLAHWRGLAIQLRNQIGNARRSL